MHIKDQAVCIRKVDYSDSSQILTLLCRDNGKISAIAKGARRSKSAFGSPIGLFSVGEIVYLPPGGGELAIIAEFDHLPLFSRLRNSLIAMNAATMMCELIDLLVDKYDPHPGLYDKFINFLEDISTGTKSHCLALLIVFQLNLLSEIGTAIPLKNCGNCNAPLAGSSEIYFCAETGGLICRDCEASFTEKIRLTPQAALAVSNPQALETIDEKTLWDIEKMMIHHFAHTLHKMPRTASFFLSQA
jgi:DNA repair protein RecO (recombination protein O)